MSDLPMKQEDHPAHNIPEPTQSYSNHVLSGDTNNKIFSYEAGDEKSNRGQGPTVENATDEAYQAWGPGRK